MTHRKLKISIIVVEHRGDGGMVHYAYQLCQSLANQNAKVTLITSKHYELDNLPHNFKVVKLLNLWKSTENNFLNPQTTNKLFLTLHQLFKIFRRLFRGIRYILEWVKLYRYLLDQNPDIIQFGKIEFKFEALFLKGLRKRNLTLTQICHEFEAREKTISSLVAKYFNGLFDDMYTNFSLIYFHAKENRDRFQLKFNIPSDHLRIIPHGNEKIFSNFGVIPEVKKNLISTYQINNDIEVILFFGILAPSKGVPYLIQAFSYVNKEKKNTKLIIAGAPSKYIDMQELFDLVAKLKLDQSVIFDSRYIPNHEIGALMSLATIVVFPYVTSTQSGSLQTAYTFGKPVIATNVGGLPEVVEHNKSGIIVPSKDAQALANAILSLVKNPRRIKIMGQYAKHLSETKFSWEPISRIIVSDYLELVHGNPN